jgi:glycosyltransferase involved in cell wall biosynthesis/O-antigen/teichoic acid export membrane protein
MRNDLRSRFSSGILGRGALSFLLASAGVNVSNFLFHIVVSRELGPAHYGAVGAILSILGLLSVPVGAAQLAITQAVIAHERDREAFHLRQLLVKTSLIGILAMVAFMALSPVIDNFLHIKSLVPLFIIGIWIPIATLGSMLQGALIGEYRFKAVAFATIIGGGPVRLAFGGLLVWLGFGVTGAITATLIAQIFSTFSLLISSRHRIVGAHHQSSIRISRRDMTLSIAAIGSYTALLGIDTFLARHFFSATVSGQYAAGAVAAHIALFVPGAIVTVAFPHWATGEGTSASSRTVFNQALSLTMVLGVLSAGFLAIFASFVVHVLFGSSYLGAVTIIGVLAFSSVAIGVINLFIYLHLARRSLFALTPWLGVALASILILIYHSSSMSVAITMLLVSFITLIAIFLPALLALATSKSREKAADTTQQVFPTSAVDLTLVVPFYNPGPRLVSHLQEIVDVLSSSNLTYEIIAVSDGSTDESDILASRFEADNFVLVRLDRNRGKGAALHAGLSIGRGEYLGFIDGDGDLPASLLYNLIGILNTEQPEIIYGSKRHPRAEVVYPPLRRLYSWGYQQLNRVLFKLPVRDTQTGVKVFRRDVLVAVLPRMVEKRFAFDLELFVVARQQGFRNFVEMPVIIGQRFGSTISVRSAFDMLRDTCAIYYRLRVIHFYDRDLRGKKEATILERRSPELLSVDYQDSLRAIEDGKESVNDVQNTRLRILILNWRDITHPRAGGAEVYTHNIAAEWVQRGHQVTIFCSSVEGRPSSELYDGITVIRRGNGITVYREAKRFYRRQVRNSFDFIVDEINTRPFFSQKWVGETPVIALMFQVCRELWFYQMPFLLALAGRYWFEPKWLRNYREVKTVTISSSSERSIENYGIRNVYVVPVGHESLLERPAVPRETSPTVVFVGRLEAHKRPEDAIRAFGILREAMPSARLWVIGTGSLEDKLRMSSPEGVQFLGKISASEKTERLARAHVLIATSVREGWGLIVTEAAEVGTPSIAYDVPGLSDSVNASGGFLTPADPTNLGNRLKELMENWLRVGLPTVSANGVIPWEEVANSIVDIALNSNEVASTNAKQTSSSSTLRLNYQEDSE